MQTQENSSQPSSFRIDKYIVNDIHDFNLQMRLQEENEGRRAEDAFSCDDRLIRNIIYSIANDYEHNLMGFGQLDPATFAKQWNYDHAYLRHRVENPYQLRHMSDDEIHAYRTRVDANGGNGDAEGEDGRVWDTQLENALYILSARPVCLNNYGEFSMEENGTKETVSVKSHATFTIISNLTAVKKSHGKTLYIYNLNENFEKNLTRYYIRGEKTSLIALRTCGLDSLYLYLANLRSNLALKKERSTKPGQLPDLDYLCRLADIPFATKDGSPVPAKMRKYQLVRALDRINRESGLELTVSWVDGDGKERHRSKGAYTPVLSFGASALLVFNENWGPGKIAADQERAAIQRQIITKNFLDMYKKLFITGTYAPVDADSFNAWALDVKRNRKEKETALRLAMIGIFQMIPGNEEAISKNFFNVLKDSGATTFSDAIAKYSI